MRLLNEVIFSSSSLTGLFGSSSFTGSTTSSALWIGHAYGFAIQTQATVQSGSMSIQLQASCDSGSKANSIAETGIGVNNWSNLPSSFTSSSIVVNATSNSGSAVANYLWNYEGTFFPWVRMVVSTSSGSSASISATINTKGI